MLRVADCPNDASRNRKCIADMRFTSGKTPVHSDMLMWSLTDPVECAATQVISSLFGVIQVSVLLDKIPEEHRKMLEFYLDFAVKNRSVLLDGEFFALTPDCGYTLAGAFNSKKEICVYYCNIVYSCNRERDEYVFINCHGEKGIYLDMKQGGSFNVEIFNCMGEKLSEEQRSLGGLCSIDVPFAGMVKLTRV
jgi:alpha-galactosidase